MLLLGSIATVGLGVSDFGYRISPQSHDWFRCCFGAWIREIAMAMANEKQEIESF